YFRHFRYGDRQNLQLQQGSGTFDSVFATVLGADVAQSLGYGLGDTLVLSHGLGATSFSQHDDFPFTVVGILAPTGTPVDQAVHVSLQGLEAIHLGWSGGVQIPGLAQRFSEQELAT